LSATFTIFDLFHCQRKQYLLQVVFAKDYRKQSCNPCRKTNWNYWNLSCTLHVTKIVSTAYPMRQTTPPIHVLVMQPPHDNSKA